MKTKSGFISNSSSTSFTFLWKDGGFEELYQLIRKYDQYFDLHYEAMSNPSQIKTCDAERVVKMIQAVEDQLSEQQPYEFEVLDKRWADHDAEVRKCLDSGKDSYGNKVSDRGWYQFDEDLKQTIKLRGRLRHFEENGLNQILSMGFGNVRGIVDFAKDDMAGLVMQMEGRHIYINKRDFALFSVANHCMSPWWKL